MRNPPRAHSIRVINAALLGRLVREMVDQRFRPQLQAARALGIDRGHYSKLVRGYARKAITQTLFESLRCYIPDRDLARALLMPQAEATFKQYRNWLRQSLRPVNLHFMVELDRPFVDLQRLLKSWHHQLPPSDLSRQRQDRQVACNRLLSNLRQRDPYRLFFDRFEKWAMRQGWRTGNSRYQLALLRVVEPLVTFRESAFIERHPLELEESGELDRYVEAALKKERILLNRAPDLQRVQEVCEPLTSSGPVPSRPTRRAAKKKHRSKRR